MSPFLHLSQVLEAFLVNIPAGDLVSILHDASKQELEKILEFYLERECYEHCSVIKELIDLELWTLDIPF